jgi:hypothetical protein
MVPILRERYLAARTGPIAALLTDPRKNETGRFWDAMAAMEKEAKVLRYCLDGHSRSKMRGYMLSMIHAGMLTKEDLPQFSDELQQELSHVFDGK